MSKKGEIEDFNRHTSPVGDLRKDLRELADGRASFLAALSVHFRRFFLPIVSVAPYAVVFFDLELPFCCLNDDCCWSRSVRLLLLLSRGFFFFCSV